MDTEAGYRAYVVGLDGHFLWSKEFFAPDDEAACEHARQFVDGHDVELWSRDRFVAKLKAGPGNSDYGVSSRNAS